MITTQPYEIKDFSGGLTDNYLDGALNQYQKADNLVLTYQGKLTVRDGSRVWIDLPSIGAARTNLLIPMDEQKSDYFRQIVNRLYVHYNTNFNDTPSPSSGLVGPSSNHLFTTGHTAANLSSYALWKKHCFIVSDDLSTPQRPQKIYPNTSDVYQLRTAGLPKPTADITFDREKWPMNRYHPNASVDTYLRDRIFPINIPYESYSTHLFNFSDNIKLRFTSAFGGLSTGVDYYTRDVDFSTTYGLSFRVSASAGGAAIALTGTDPPGAYSIFGTYMEFYDISSAPNLVFLYAYCFEYTYTVDQTEQVQHIDFGAPRLVTLNRLAPFIPSAVLTFVHDLDLNVITSGTYPGQNWDVGSGLFKITLYRTTANGATFYKHSSFVNSSIAPSYTFPDNVTDAQIINGELAYFNGGVLYNDLPPPSKYIHIVNNIGYYGAIREEGTSQILENRVRQSVPNDIDSCPGSLYQDFDTPTRGISSHKNIPIIFCRDAIYRINGIFDELGRGGMDPQKISDQVGCISHLSCVQTPAGVFFASTNGFYRTDGYSVEKISQGFDATYQSALTNTSGERKIQGVYDERFQRIIWAFPNNTSENNFLFILDLRFGAQTGGVFTTIGKENAEIASPTALMIFNGTLYRADHRSYIYKHDESYYSDSLDAYPGAITTWKTQAIDWLYKSCVITFGTTFARKWVPKINILAAGDTNLSLQITSINDDGRSTKELAPIVSRSLITWGDAEVVWGQPNLIWNYQGLIDESRRFPAGGLRCQSKTIQMESAPMKMIWSDYLGTVSVNSSTKQATLETGAIADWPADPLGWTIYFAEDNYTTGYEITARTDDTITFSDPSNTSVTRTGMKWEIWGTPKDQRFHLISYALHYAYLSKTQKPYQSDVPGGNE